MEYPTGSGQQLTLDQIADDLSRRLISIFLRGPDGRRPVFGGTEVMQTDPHWRDHILFYEYFHGDNGAGIGASHQTGWTAVVANLIDRTAADCPSREVVSRVKSVEPTECRGRLAKPLIGRRETRPGKPGEWDAGCPRRQR